MTPSRWGCSTTGSGVGDRVAVYLQNIPQFVIGMVAIWKAGAIMVSINPMYREREVGGLLNDSAAVATICLESLYTDAIAKVRDSTSLRVAITTSELDFQDKPNPRLFAEVSRHRSEGTPTSSSCRRKARRRHPTSGVARSV